jgi:hypothetical protein
MDTQTQDALRQILLKLGGLESTVARLEETLKLGRFFPPANHPLYSPLWQPQTDLYKLLLKNG